MNATSIAPPIPTMESGKPLANGVTSPVFGSTREILPAAPSVTYNAPPGPMPLPEAPARPVTNWAAADNGVIVPITVAASIQAEHVNTADLKLVRLRECKTTSFIRHLFLFFGNLPSFE